jgi:SAM-dependent methyltransferase
MPLPAARRLAKRRAEIEYWKRRAAAEGGLTGTHYERFFTTYFGLVRADYDGRRVLDVGCGPRGTLEWADMAAERVGLDPLADAYRELGSGAHAMTYVQAAAEAIPFGDAHFDVVSAFNSMDHVDDLDAAIAEIARVTRPGGMLLLLTDVGHDPTFTEPQSFSWDVTTRFAPAFEVERESRIAHTGPGMMESLDASVPADGASGILSALLRRVG